MDVLIKNFEMPKSCYSDEFVYCPFQFFDYNTKSHCELSDDIRCTKTRRPKDCPLVELPPHGDLIDRRELLKHRFEVYDRNEEVCQDYVETYHILEAPVVLEAST